VTVARLPFEQAFREWVDERGMGWERIRFPIHPAGETTTGYRFTPASAPARTVVALHGAGNDALFGWVGLFKRLLAGGAEVFTFDLPGHGRFNQTVFEGEIAVEAVLRAVETCTGGRRKRPLHAVGVSLGGSVLLGSLPRLQDHLSSAALIVAPLRIHLNARSIAREVGARTFRIVWNEREHYGLTGLIPSFGNFKRDIYPLRLAAPPPPGLFGYVEALNGTLDEMALLDAAAGVRIPVLLVYGERDRIVPPEQGEQLARALPSGELLRVRRGTHLSTPLEPETTERLTEWLERPGHR
jgi:alpha-beta hydrolase superfamily lysophospholipase